MRTPYPFQEIGIDHMASNHRAYLGDQPGLGKTPQALWAAKKLGVGEGLVTCPASVREHWWEDIEDIFGTTRGWDVVSYPGAVKLAHNPKKKHYDVLIPDEAQFLKTVESQRTQAILGNKIGIARYSDYIWPLSGTPILNRPFELYPIIKSLWGHNLGEHNTVEKFGNYFCNAFYDGYGINRRGAAHLEELRDILKGFMLRRTKREVFPELPEAIVSRIPFRLAPAQLRMVEAVEDEIENREAYLSATFESFAALGDLARMRRVVGLAKVPFITAFLDDLLKTVDKVVVFAWHREVIEQLAAEALKRKWGPVIHWGGMTDAQKEEVKFRFMVDPNCRFFIGNIRSAGVGIDGLQTVCNDAVFAEIDWAPFSIGQAIGRLDRMGRPVPLDVVNAYIPHALGTMESAMLGSSDGKVRVIDILMDDEARIPRTESDDILRLLH